MLLYNENQTSRKGGMRMLMRTDPFREFDRLAQQAFGTRFRPALMPMDAYRQEDQLVVHFDLPGVDPDSVDLTVEKNVLTVSAERRWDPPEDLRIVASERPQGTFNRQLFLGEGLDADKIEASYDNGVLTVTIPVAEQAKPRKVLISAGNGAKTIQASASKS
jgi:HSP20 family protein